MARNALGERNQSRVEPVGDALDHVRGPTGARLIIEYGDYECPFSRRAFREIERVEGQLNGGIRFSFRHFPLVDIHPHAFAAAAAAEAAALQDRFWETHELLFHRQTALADDDLQRYASQLGLDVGRFDQDCFSHDVFCRVRRDIEKRPRIGRGARHPDAFHRPRLVSRRRRRSVAAEGLGPVTAILLAEPADAEESRP